MDTVAIMFILVAVASLTIGAGIGWTVACEAMHSKASGNLVIATDSMDHSNYIFLEITRWSIEQLRNQQVIELTVVDKTRK